MQWLIPGIIGAGFIGFGIFLLIKEIRFASGQATGIATVLGKDFYLSDGEINTGSRVPGFYLQCEVAASKAKPACRGAVRINFFSWLGTEKGHQINVRYNRPDGRDMRLARSLGNWPACVFLFFGGGIVALVWMKSLIGH
jgi:hypothetical protein